MAPDGQPFDELWGAQGLIQFRQELSRRLKSEAAYETRIEQTGGESVPEKAGDKGVGISDDLHRRDDFS